MSLISDGHFLNTQGSHTAYISQVGVADGITPSGQKAELKENKSVENKVEKQQKETRWRKKIRKMETE